MSEPIPAPAPRPARLFLPAHPEELASEKLGLRSIDLAAITSALPAVLAGLGIIAVIFWLRSPRPLEPWYEERTNSSLATQDYPTASLCLKRLIQIHPENPMLRYRLALALNEQGRAKLRLAETLKDESKRAMTEEAMGLRSRAFSLIRQLAPEDRPGDVPQAHLWLASVLMFEYASSEAILKSVETHLKYYLKRAPLRGDPDPNSIGAKALLGHVYVLTRRYKNAQQYLEESASRSPTLLVELAEVYRALGETSEAERRAKEAVDQFAPKVNANPDNVEARASLATATSIVGDYTGALDILNAGLRRSEAPGLRHAMAQVYLNWADSVAAPSLAPAPAAVVPDLGARTPQRVELLELGLRNEPSNREIVEKLARIADPTTKDGDALEQNAARSTLVTLAASGKGPPEVYDDLAKDAFHRKQLEQARAYWEQAYKAERWDSPDRLESRHAVLANNLAWVVSRTEPVNLPGALKLADKALELKPGYPSFRGTRGEVLAKMGRDKEAIEELKAAVDGKAATAETRKLLRELEAKQGPPGTEAKPGRPAESNAEPSS